MLDLNFYTDKMEDIAAGETARVNHETCDAGIDTRRRLYLTRTHADPTVIIAYCHNCQQGGRWKDGDWKEYRDKRHANVSTHKEVTYKEVVPPPNMVYVPSDWPTDAMSWMYKSGLNKKFIERYGIAYDPSSNRVYLPRYDEFDWKDDRKGELIGYQLRSVDGQGSKYLTVQKDGTNGWTEIYNSDFHADDYAIIVEDLVSALAIIEATTMDQSNGPNVFVNYGTKIDPVMMHRIANDYKWCVVWLDNDSTHVQNQARLMVRTIKMYSNKIMAKAILKLDDPKHYDGDVITRELDEVWDG